jgi:hypothetical protein
MTSLPDTAIRFIRLHQRHFVERWQAVFQGAMVRATTDRGVTATVRLDELEGLVEAGLLAPGWGGSFVLTERGKGI